MIPRLIFFGLVIAVVYYFFFRKNYAVQITLTSDGVIKSRGVSLHVKRQLDQFAKGHIAPGVELKLNGSYMDRKLIRWETPNEHPEMVQQLRNFLVNEIKM